MASDVFFTTNPSEFTKVEGLYVSESDPPSFIQGLDLSTVGIAGKCVRGPLTPTEITSASRFLELFGGRDRGSGGTLVGEVWASMLNKPFGKIVVRRVAASDAVKASLTIETGTDGAGTQIARIDAANVGLWGNDVSVHVEDASDGDATHWNLRVQYLGSIVVYENLNTSTGVDNLNEVLGVDDARLVDVTKLANGRPANFSTIVAAAWTAADGSDGYMALGTTVTGYTSVAGTDGTLAAADYTTAVTELGYYAGVGIVMVAGVPTGFTDEINGFYVTLAAAVTDRIFLTGGAAHAQSVATEKTNLTTDITTRTDRIIWCYNAFYTLDPTTALEIQRPPHEMMASILSQNDVDIHPGARQTTAQTAGIRRLASETLTRADLIDLRAHGISTLERLPGMFVFRSGVTTNLTSGRSEITRRRMADFLQLSAADKLRDFVKAKNTVENRAQLAGLLVGFSQSLRDQGRVIEEFAVEQAAVNTASQRARGIEKVLWRVRLIGHILHLVLETEIGTGVVIESE